ncbi:MAG TPA: SMC family ATPase, partial [Aggregatilineales bacterium]|nr:SMC family ATPase [Aggregatilineales bacterium]
MLPIRLELRNFLAYRSPAPILFEGLHLACLSGPNGAGKSSLLDAITWVLWGHARARTDEELIHIGQDEMSVAFEFEQDGLRYRVQRERHRNGRGTLYLSRWDEDEGKYAETIGGTNNRTQTQEQITRILRLDYETFIHSAFVQQGKADAFTTARPAQRKETLAKILRLSEWESREARVKEQLADLTSQLNVLEALIQADESQEAEQAPLEEKKAKALIELDAARQAREEAEAQFDEVAGAQEALSRAREQVAAAAHRVQGGRDELARIEAVIAAKAARRDAFQEMLVERETIEADYARYQQARRTLDDQADRLKRLTAPQIRLNRLHRDLDKARAALLQDVKVYAERIARAEAEAANGKKAAGELVAIDARIAVLDRRSDEVESLREQIATLAAESTRLSARNDELARERARLRDRLRLIRSAEAICPVCYQPLGDEHRAALEGEYTAEGLACKTESETNETQIQAIQVSIGDCQRQIDQIAAELRHREGLQKQAGKLTQQIDRAASTEAGIAADRESLNRVRAELDGERFAAELRIEIANVEAEIAAIGYDLEVSDAAADLCRQLSEAEDLKRDLDNAAQMLPELEAELAELETQHTRRRAELEHDLADTARLEAEIAALEARSADHRTRLDRRNKLRVEERGAQDRLNHIEQALIAIANSREHMVQMRARREDLRAEKSMREDLREAFSKNGVPAMIIDSAIPELEHATNRLLSRMTDGRMHV